MKITNENKKNPYLLSFVKKNKISENEEFKAYEYISWIDKKHNEFRKMRNLPGHIELTGKEKERFLHFIGFYD